MVENYPFLAPAYPFFRVQVPSAPLKPSEKSEGFFVCGPSWTIGGRFPSALRGSTSPSVPTSATVVFTQGTHTAQLRNQKSRWAEAMQPGVHASRVAQSSSEKTCAMASTSA